VDQQREWFAGESGRGEAEKQRHADLCPTNHNVRAPTGADQPPEDERPHVPQPVTPSRPEIDLDTVRDRRPGVRAGSLESEDLGGYAHGAPPTYQFKVDTDGPALMQDAEDR
jgi:hypothetical protein